MIAYVCAGMLTDEKPGRGRNRRLHLPKQLNGYRTADHSGSVFSSCDSAVNWVYFSVAAVEAEKEMEKESQ